jgi:glycosyltransferase involved in cell wall biosynthesis
MRTDPILLVTHEPLEPRLAGPAIRAWHLAHELAGVRPTWLATPAVRDMRSSDITLVTYDRGAGAPLGELASQASVVIASGYLLRRYPTLVQADTPLVVDVYDPFVLENLEIHASKPPDEQIAIHQSNLKVLAEQLRLGDFFLCASETQRDFWLGVLLASGRVNPLTLSDDPTLRRLIDVVPFGLPEAAPASVPGVIKGQIPGIGRDDRVIYWGGGIWDWFDPLTLIRAVAQIAEQNARVKLLFAGVRHPSPDVPPMRMCQAAQDLSDSLGLTDRVVFFNDWVPYQERGAYLLEADVGVSLHFAHVETRFSFRTRLLDYLWAGLPMVITQGDTISEWVKQEDLGRVVAPEDVDSTRRALTELLESPGFRAQAAPRFDALRHRLHWSQVSGPLRAFCAQPYRAADRSLAEGPSPTAPLWVRSWRVLRERGVSELVREARSYLAWRLRSG